MKRAIPLLTTRPQLFASATLPLATTWLLGECMEYRGKQELWSRQKPEALAALRQQAIIQSVESSNRIEGITVPADRLRPVVLGRSRPRNRPEEELAGYRRGLSWIFSRKSPVPMTARTLLHLHALCQSGASDAGKLKSRDNEIIEVTPRGEHVVRFRPTPAIHTLAAIDNLADSYALLAAKQQVPPLLLVASVVLDFLCIHPFRDGNGRVSRLLTALLLEQHGYIVGRYVSLERLIEEEREGYYQALHQCSQDWSEGQNPVIPWWNYFLTIVRRAYAEFAARMESAGAGAGKSALARQTALAQIGPFTLAELHAQLPGISAALLKKVLADLRHHGRVHLTGRGRGARWSVAAG